MTKLKVMLFGRYAHRTPMGYTEYAPLFSQHVDFVFDAYRADILVTGSVRDFEQHIELVGDAARSNPELKLVVMSEEPFWDTVWGDDFYNRMSRLSNGFEYTNMNHATSCVFNFERVPYFITTHSKFFSRYADLFSRNAKLNIDVLRAHFSNTQSYFAALAEKRLSKKYDVTFELDSGTVTGLCRYRTLATKGLKEALGHGQVTVDGRGWGDVQVRRQDIADWHMDKLTRFDQKVRFMSAIENTDHPGYVTEKLFDAFAMLAVPVVFANSSNTLEKAVGDAPMVNMQGKPPEALLDELAGFKFNDEFFTRYQQTMKRLEELYSDSTNLDYERQHLVSKVILELNNLK